MPQIVQLLRRRQGATAAVFAGDRGALRGAFARISCALKLPHNLYTPVSLRPGGIALARPQTCSHTLEHYISEAASFLSVDLVTSRAHKLIERSASETYTYVQR